MLGWGPIVGETIYGSMNITHLSQLTKYLVVCSTLVSLSKHLAFESLGMT